MDELKKLIINGYTQNNIWNKLIKMLKFSAKRSRREISENIPVTDAVTPITPISVIGNDDGKRIPKKVKQTLTIN